MLDVELASIDRSPAELAARIVKRETDDCMRAEQMHELELQLEALNRQAAEQQLAEISVSRELAELEETESSAHKRAVAKLDWLERTHAWHLQHQEPAAREAAKEAEWGAGDAVDDGAGLIDSGGSSSGSHRGGSRKRQRRTTHHWPTRRHALNSDAGRARGTRRRHRQTRVEDARQTHHSHHTTQHRQPQQASL